MAPSNIAEVASAREIENGSLPLSLSPSLFLSLSIASIPCDHAGLQAAYYCYLAKSPGSDMAPTKRNVPFVDCLDRSAHTRACHA